jgi:hypothetical protein
MLGINKTTTLSLIGFAALGLAAFGQETPQTAPQQQPAPQSKEAMAARRQAMQKLTTDFAAAVKSSSLSADDQQKAQNAIAELQPHVKGVPRDPKGRHQAMQLVRQMSTNPALRQEDRDLLTKDLAALPPARPQHN